MRLLFMGPPGAGKGTQAQLLSERLGIPQVSTGDIFRANIAAGSDLGRTAQTYLDAGDYVPDDLTNAMVRDRLGQADCADGFLLDGYPRTVDQVAALDAILGDSGDGLDVVLVLTVDEDELVGRLIKRAETSGRTDDTEDVIRHRQEVFAAQTAPLLQEYGRRGLVVEVDGVGDVDDVAKRILDALPDA